MYFRARIICVSVLLKKRIRFFRRPDGRYYVILESETDLLGDLILVTRPGSDGSRRGGQKIYCCIDGQAEKIERRLVATRLRHEYEEITDPR